MGSSTFNLTAIATAAADGTVGAKELGLATGEAAAYMTATTTDAQGASTRIIETGQERKIRLLDEMNGALGTQETALSTTINTSMLSISNSWTAAKSLASVATEEIIANWKRVPTEVVTKYKIVTEGTVPGLPAAPTSIPGKQSGGPVYAGHAYRVGEAGPETIIMGGNGHVIPHGQAALNPIININVNGAGDANAIAQQVSRIVARQLRGMISSGVGIA